ncbi:MAG: hypothetical protein WCQ47_07585, partial [bacterium]
TTVHVAMFDPTQDRCLSEMCFFTNLKVVPYGALASDITKALNKYYGLSLPEILRYGKEAIDPTYKGPQIPVLKPEPVVVSTSKLPPLPKMPVKPVIPTVPFVEKMTLPPLPPLHGKAIKREDIKESVSSVQTASKSVLEEIKRPVEKQKPTNVVNEKIKRMQDNFDKLSDMVSAEEEPSLMVDYDDEAPEFNDVSAGAYVQQIRYIAIEQGRNKDAVLNATMAEIKKISSRSVIMFIKYDDIVPIVGAGNGIIDNINNLKLSLSESSIFSTVYSTKREYYGPMPKGLVSDRFLDHFGHHMPESIAIVPSMIDDEVFCLIYAEDTDETLELKKIADSMSNAFNRLLGNV